MVHLEQAEYRVYQVMQDFRVHKDCLVIQAYKELQGQQATKVQMDQLVSLDSLAPREAPDLPDKQDSQALQERRVLRGTMVRQVSRVLLEPLELRVLPELQDQSDLLEHRDQPVSRVQQELLDFKLHRD